MEILDEIRETINTLVNIANGENVQLTRRQAYLAVRTMDLTEGYIARVDFTDGKWDKYKEGGTNVRNRKP